MPIPLLSTYSTGENRVTSSTRAVFERLDLALVRELLAGATGSGDELSGVIFQNQVPGKRSVPDALISARFSWWFETKIQHGAYAAEGHARRQLRHHAAQFAHDADARLFVLTPDPIRPAWFDQLDGVADDAKQRVVWIGFRDIANHIARITADPNRLLDERTRFLLSELVAFYEAEGLLSSDDTVVVAARSAWPEYQRRSAYICQPNRSFREGVSHLGFYASGAVQPLVPRILEMFRAVEFSQASIDELRRVDATDLAELVESVLADGSRSEGASYDVLLLSAPDAADTLRLPAAILNDARTAAGGNWAWTLNQRYTSIEALRLARTTSDLDRRPGTAERTDP
jgi:hypothetical protein